jgi:SAM-dependent methyltransferase
MPNSESGLDNVDFQHLYQGDPSAGPKLPWDLGAPQPLVVALADAGEFSGEVLDIGCGLGGNAAFLASRGLRVTGLDCAPAAVEQARARAAVWAAQVTFAVADATELAGYEDRFDTVLDSALYHCLTTDQRHEYLAALGRATRPGARLHVLCFSTALRGGFPDRHLVSEDSLRETVGQAWTIERLEAAAYTTACTPPELAAGVRAMQGADAADFDGSGLQTDEQGRALLPIWQLTAVRGV